MKFKSQGLVVIGVHLPTAGEERKSIEDFVKQHDITFPVAIDAGDTYRQYAAYGWPSYYLINKAGRLVWGPEHDLPSEKQILALLAERESSSPPATQLTKEKRVDQGPPDTAFSDNHVEAVKKDADRDPSLGRISMRGRIDEHIKKLRSEDTRASLRNLSQAEMFIWPGYPTGAFGGNMTLPLPRGIESGRTETILSNRRFLKVLKELSERSPSEASRMVREEIESTLPLYRKMFETTWEQVLETRRLHPLGKEGGTVGPSLRLSDNPDGSPTLFGLCYKLQSLVLVAGNLGLDEVRSAAWTTVDEAMKQRDRFYRGEGEEPDRFAMFDRVGIYNRQVLATGIIGTRPGRQNRSLAAEASDKTKWETRELTLYDAAMTPYDIPVRHRVLPVAYSKGKQTVHYYRIADDKDFDVILKTYRPK